MRQYPSFPPLPNNDDDWAGERFVAEDPFALPVTPPRLPAMPVAEKTAEQPRAAEAKTGQPRTVSGPVYDIATTQSLVAALQSTMTRPARQPVVIPGSRKRRTPTTDELVRVRRMHPRLRFAIVIGVLIFVILTSLLSLTPLGSGQTGFSPLDDLANWVRTQEQGWNITSHTNGAAQQQVAAPPVQLPPMTLPKSQYIAIAQQAAVNAGIPPDYFVRQIYLESGFNPNAVSPSGAVGIAQFIPSTAANLGVNPYDPISALNGAARLMASYAKQYGGDYAKALAAYNAGSGTVNRAIMLGGANWMNFLPGETRNYIYRIMGI